MNCKNFLYIGQKEHFRNNICVVPRKVVVIDALPRNALGKVEKVQLRDVARNLVPSPSVVSKL